MWELIKTDGWLMLPLLLASTLALAISLERAWTLRTSRVAPSDLLARVWQWIRNNQLDAAKLAPLVGASEHDASGEEARPTELTRMKAG